MSDTAPSPAADPLPFYWEMRAGILVVADVRGEGCHPATIYEERMVAEIDRLRAELASRDAQPPADSAP